MGRLRQSQCIDCAPIRNPTNGGDRQVGCLWPVIPLLLFAGTSPAGATPEAPASTIATHVGSTQSFPMELLVSLLESLFRLLGGDPDQLEDPRLTLTTRMNIVRGQYETGGVPENLSPLQRQQILDTILATHVLIQDPIVGLFAGDKAVLLFDGSLHDMWHDLEGPGPLLA